MPALPSCREVHQTIVSWIPVTSSFVVHQISGLQFMVDDNGQVCLFEKSCSLGYNGQLCTVASCFIL